MRLRICCSDVYFFLLFILFLFFSQVGFVWLRQMIISRHYFVFLFLFFFWRWWVCLAKTAEYFSSLFCFFFFFFLFSFFVSLVRLRRFSKDGWIFLVTILFFYFFFFYSLLAIYYAQDSCKKWQENKGKLSLRSRMNRY